MFGVAKMRGAREVRREGYRGRNRGENNRNSVIRDAGVKRRPTDQPILSHPATSIDRILRNYDPLSRVDEQDDSAPIMRACSHLHSATVHVIPARGCRARNPGFRINYKL